MAFRVTAVPDSGLVVWLVKIGAVTRWAVADGTGAPACQQTAPTPITSPAQTPPTGPQAPAVDDLQPIGVFVSCVRPNRDGSYAVVFGYDNPNAVAVQAPAGPLNTVAPALRPGDDQGQVVEFMPGHISDAWTIAAVSSTQQVTWTVSANGTSVATAGANSPQCASGGPTAPPKSPPMDPTLRAETIGVFASCVRVTGSTYTASFGYELSGGASTTVPLGIANRFTTRPAKRSQVTEFIAGRHPDAFSISGIPLRQTLTWRVVSPNGSVATATATSSGPDCVTAVPPEVPPVNVVVPSQPGVAVTGLLQPQTIVISNRGTATATDVVVVVPSTPLRQVTSSHRPGPSICDVASNGTIHIASLAPGVQVRCTVGVKVYACDPGSRAVTAAVSARNVVGVVGPRSGGTGGRAGCHAGSSGIVG